MNDQQGQTSTTYWSLSGEAALQQLNSTRRSGLDAEQVQQRLQHYGTNTLQVQDAESMWSILWRQFKNLMVVFLAAAAVLSLLLDEHLEAVAILVVILINAVLGFITELRAIRSLEALQRLSSLQARVLREGRVLAVDIDQLVPGDIVVLEGGDLVAADMRLLEQSRLQVNESTLTGESLPSDKAIDTLAPQTLLAERHNMLYRGTAITRGSAVALVVATGMQTELGQIAALVASGIGEQETPLEQRLLNLGRRLLWFTLLIAAAVIGVGLLQGAEPWPMVETGIALAVATIPEGLPVVATIAMARGMWRMARRNALIRSLAAVETLGMTAVIFTDKTGTLTENRMSVHSLRLAGRQWLLSELAEHATEADVAQALQVMSLCNNAQAEGLGDPLEVALLQAAATAGIEHAELEATHPRREEFAFDTELRLMATLHSGAAGSVVLIKGAPEAIIGRCRSQLVEGEVLPLDESGQLQWQADNAAMAEHGLRVLALARLEGIETLEDIHWQDLTLIGLVGLMDPPRSAVRAAVADCHRAGLQVIMVTGDQRLTARNIAIETGVIEGAEAPVINGDELELMMADLEQYRPRIMATRVFSRVSPAQKLQLVQLYQQAGLVVSMTGDGVNDAPALKKADIGIAMGQRGTQVARDASDMVLKDDAFTTIVMAIAQGRVIFNNLRRFVVYLLSCNLSEVLVIALATLLALPLPLLPLQILYLNLVTDVFPALALGMCEGDDGVMRQTPRPRDEPILSNRSWWVLLGYGVLLTVAVFGLYLAAYGYWRLGEDKVVTMSFAALALAQMFHVFNMRSVNSGLLNNDVTRNPYIWYALLLCGALIYGAIALPGLNTVLHLVPLSLGEWAWVLLAALAPTVLLQLVFLLLSWRQRELLRA